MTPNILMQIFRRHGPWLTVRGWTMVGGFVAAGFLLATFMFQWR